MTVIYPSGSSLCVQSGCKNTGFQRENEAAPRGECVAKLKLSISWEKVDCPMTANISRGVIVTIFRKKEKKRSDQHRRISQNACVGRTGLLIFRKKQRKEWEKPRQELDKPNLEEIEEIKMDAQFRVFYLMHNEEEKVVYEGSCMNGLGMQYYLKYRSKNTKMADWRKRHPRKVR